MMRSPQSHSKSALTENLVEEIKYKIAIGVLKVNDPMPSTRNLGDRLGVSFHTVRKAYQELERQGYLAVSGSRHYRVVSRDQAGKTERMEAGAAIVQDALRRLVGLGLEDEEVRYLFEEQIDEVFKPQKWRFAFAAAYPELVEGGVQQLHDLLHEPIEGVTFDFLRSVREADLLITPFMNIRAVQERLPKTEIQGVFLSIAPEVLQMVAEVLPNETIVLVARDSETIPYLIAALKVETGFAGQLFGITLDGVAAAEKSLLETAQVVLFTPACKRRLVHLLSKKRHAMVHQQISRESCAFLLQKIPRQAS